MLHTLESTGFKSGELGGHISGEVDSGVSLSWNSTAEHFDDVKLTSSLRSVVQVVIVFYMSNLLNFVKVMPKIPVVRTVLIRTRCTILCFPHVTIANSSNSIGTKQFRIIGLHRSIRQRGVSWLQQQALTASSQSAS